MIVEIRLDSNQGYDPLEKPSGSNPCPLYGKMTDMNKVETKVMVYVLIERSTGKTRVLYTSNCTGGNHTVELWCGKETGRGFIYHQDAYYDEKLRKRRNDGNMISPVSPLERLIYVGEIWGAGPVDQNTYFILSKSELAIPIVSVD
jgi:hypothetical protein